MARLFGTIVQEVICPDVSDVANMVISLYCQGVGFDTDQKPRIDDEGMIHLFVTARDGQIRMALEEFNAHKAREFNFNKTTHRATFS